LAPTLHLAAPLCGARAPICRSAAACARARSSQRQVPRAPTAWRCQSAAAGAYAAACAERRALSSAEDVRGSVQSEFSAMAIRPPGTSCRKAATAAACARRTLPVHCQTWPLAPLRSWAARRRSSVPHAPRGAFRAARLGLLCRNARMRASGPSHICMHPGVPVRYCCKEGCSVVWRARQTQGRASLRTGMPGACPPVPYPLKQKVQGSLNVAKRVTRSPSARNTARA